MMLHTDVVDVPSLVASMKALGWSLADLSLAARMPLEHVEALLAGRAFSPRSVRRIVEVVNGALAARDA